MGGGIGADVVERENVDQLRRLLGNVRRSGLENYLINFEASSSKKNLTKSLLIKEFYGSSRE